MADTKPRFLGGALCFRYCADCDPSQKAFRKDAEGFFRPYKMDDPILLDITITYLKNRIRVQGPA
jgi:hypothetical protein